jgi:hypothetical protein
MVKPVTNSEEVACVGAICAINDRAFVYMLAEALL